MAIDIAVAVLLFVLSCVLYWGMKSAYTNGVTDGFGYAREPRNPGYREAGKYLRENMAHRWPELKQRDGV